MEWLLIGIAIVVIWLLAISGWTVSSPPETEEDVQTLSRLKAEMGAGRVSDELKPILDRVAEYQAKGWSKNDSLNAAVARHREDREHTAIAVQRLNARLEEGQDFDPGVVSDAVIADVERGVEVFKALQAAIPRAVMGQIAAISTDIRQRQLDGAALPEAIRTAIRNFCSRH